ncbi:PREDICTED: uncharacterized protein LOC109160415 [Ipomoea nil]|uniref:uncharacterized protein LOC109160415 n=1 Tax=Ipomoea nil TaxID=35883 RepID=UPI000900956D|nr:PREDICTED: uncharacterized protein LOC109160415 [Ipomoea nil]
MALSLYCNICARAETTCTSLSESGNMDEIAYVQGQRQHSYVNNSGVGNYGWKPTQRWNQGGQTQGRPQNTQGSRPAYDQDRDRCSITYSPQFGGSNNALYRSPQVSQSELRHYQPNIREVDERLSRAILELKNDRVLLKQEITQEFRQDLSAMRQETQTSIKSMEIQIAQLVKLVSERPCGSLLSTTENNPKERVNAISVYPEPVNEDTNKRHEGKYVKGKEVLKDTDREESKANTKMVTSRYCTQIPFPQRLVNMAELEQRGKFNALLRKLHVNMPILYTLRELPRLTYHFKELVKNKKEIHNESHTHLSVECSSALERGCPKKKGDPGAFIVPFAVKDLFFENALADLGAFINVMPSCVLTK